MNVKTKYRCKTIELPRVPKVLAVVLLFFVFPKFASAIVELFIEKSCVNCDYNFFSRTLTEPEILLCDNYSYQLGEDCQIAISDFQPRQGPAGTYVTITGSGFSEGISVKFNNQIATDVSVISPNEVKARLPEGAFSGPIFIAADCETFSTTRFEVISTYGTNGATDLFISAVVEGSSYNKAVVIANFTGSPVNLSDYTIEVYFNGTPTLNVTATVQLPNVVLENNQIWVVVDYQADNLLKTYANQIKSTPTWFNGNDAVALAKNGVLIDIFGNIGCNPGTAWRSGSHSTLDRTLIRKPPINAGVNINPGDTLTCLFPTLADEWDVYACDTYYPIRSHIVDYNPSIPHITTQPEDIDICMETVAQLSVSATNVTQYQWKKLKDYRWEDMQGETNSTLNFTANESNDGDIFYCQISNPNGWTASNAVKISFSPDVDAPILSIQNQAVEFCVENITEAYFDEETMDVVANNPDWRILRNTELDIAIENFNDLCCAAEMLTLQWKIVFSDGSTFPADGQFMSGQPSVYFSTLTDGFKLPGHAIEDVEHSIFYRLQDCNGNISEPQEVNIIIMARPQLSKK